MTITLPVAKPKREHRPNTTDILPLFAYKRIIVSFSGGKDSLACLLDLLRRGVPKDQIELWHQHVDGDEGSTLMDWPCTAAYCRAVAAALGVRIRFQWREGGIEREMLRNKTATACTHFELEDGTIGSGGGNSGRLNTRLKFPQISPDLSVRWCSAYAKIDVASVAMNNDPACENGPILFITGERREESPGRSLYAEREKHRCSRPGRRVDHYRSIINWSEREVWSIIELFGINPHWCYHLGWGRCSCMSCIFGDSNQWATIRQMAPSAFNTIDLYEQQFGITINRDRSVVAVADGGTSMLQPGDEIIAAKAMSKTYLAADVFVKKWVLPRGAFKHCGGPS